MGLVSVIVLVLAVRTRELPVPNNQDFLLYPLDTGEDPACLGCGKVMMVAGREVAETKPDFIIFRCEKCGRSEKFICDE
jgi:tRNA(Ile2) C34 agmatinyltransferase TiaS